MKKMGQLMVNTISKGWHKENWSLWSLSTEEISLSILQGKTTNLSPGTEKDRTVNVKHNYQKMKPKGLKPMSLGIEVTLSSILPYKVRTDAV